MLSIGSIAGWLGMIILLIAYWLISYRNVKPVSFFYQGLFLFGSLCFVISAYLTDNIPIALFNAFLVLVTGYKIYRIAKK